MYFPIKWGAKEPQNPQNHRVVNITTPVRIRIRAFGGRFFLFRQMFCRDSKDILVAPEWSYGSEWIKWMDQADQASHMFHGIGMFTYIYKTNFSH